MSIADASRTEASGAVIDRLFEALAQGDADGARACCTADAVVWHSFDRVPMSLDEATQSWRELIANFPERTFVDVRRSAIPGGFVQRHMMVATTAAGVRLAWPLCIFMNLRDGRVARLDEYIDRAGSYVVADDALATPGLPPRGDGRSALT